MRIIDVGYIIVWRSKKTGAKGRDKKVFFDHAECLRVCTEFDKTHPDIIHQTLKVANIDEAP